MKLTADAKLHIQEHDRLRQFFAFYTPSIRTPVRRQASR